MRIYKIAQNDGGDGGDGGYVDIELRLTPDGKFSTKILGHGEGSSCQSEDDMALMMDLLNAHVDEFGDIFEKPDDEGHTEEYYETERQEQTVSDPQAQKPDDAPFGEAPRIEAPKKKKTLDMGYGV